MQTNNSGKKKKSIFKRWWFWVLLIIIIVGIGAAGSGGSGEPRKVTADKSDSAASEKKTDGQETQKEEQKKKTFTIGDTADFDGVQVKLSSAALSNGDGEFTTPEEGKQFLCLVFDIDNRSRNEIGVSSLASFEAYCDQYSLNEEITAGDLPEIKGKGQLDGTVAAGRKMSGAIVYQVPQDFKEFEIKFQPDFWRSKKVTFTVPADAVKKQ